MLTDGQVSTEALLVWKGYVTLCSWLLIAACFSGEDSMADVVDMIFAWAAWPMNWHALAEALALEQVQQSSYSSRAVAACAPS